MTQRRMVITIEHDGPTVPFDAFLSVTRRTVGLLRGVDSEFSGEGSPTANWEICAVSMQSPLRLTLTPAPVQETREVCDSIGPFIEDMNALERGEHPRYLTPELQQMAKELVKALNGGIRAIRFSSEDQEARPTQRIAAHVVQLEQRHFETGSIEGRLDVISVHGQQMVKVWDARSNRAVKCRVSELQLEDAKQLLGKRVALRGRIRYGHKLPNEIEDVFEIRMLEDPQGLPQIEDIAPVDLTGGREPADYLRG